MARHDPRNEHLAITRRVSNTVPLEQFMTAGGAAMRRIRSIIAICVLCAAALSTGTGPASACGSPLIYPLLFRAYSEAGRAYDAERAARRGGELSAAVWTAEKGPTYHQWSITRAREVLDRLAARLNRAAEAAGADFTVSIMLADEVYVAHLQATTRDVALKPMNLGHPKSAISFYTTVNALRAFIDGRIGWQDAVERDLVVMSRHGDGQEEVQALLRKALSLSALSN